MQHNQASKSTLTDKQKFELCQYARDNRQTLKEYDMSTGLRLIGT